MLKKLTRSVQAATGVILLLVMLLTAAPAAAADAAWTAEVIPTMQNTVLAPGGMDIRDMAVYGASTVYAAPGDSLAEDILFKTTNGGSSWSSASVPFQADIVAVSPSNGDIVAIAESATGHVSISLNGGQTWNDLGIPQQSGAAAATAIYDLDVSEVIGSYYYLAAAGTESGGPANIWYYNTGAPAPSWQETNSATGFSAADQAAAVAFSPNFASDRTLLAITADFGNTVSLQIFKEAADQWNNFAGFSSYPLTIQNGSSITTLDAASISPAPTFNSSNAGDRLAFIGLAGAGGGIYRIRNDTVNALKTNDRIRSIAYNGSRLVAGAYDSSAVYSTSEPLSLTPTLGNIATGKAPGGANRVMLAWLGGNVAAGTSGDESAFAISGNYGSAFNDISLVDTTIDSIEDVAVSDDGETVYMTSGDGSSLSLWRRTTGNNEAITWNRIFHQAGSSEYIVRIDPEDLGAVYLAGKDTPTIYRNSSSGDAAWQSRNCKINVKDITLVDVRKIYVINSNGEVTESHDAGFTWSTPVATGLGSGATIYSFDEDNLVAGSGNGYVAYSTDGNANWTLIPEILEGGAGNVQVITSENFEENRVIYAASDTAGGNIWRWDIDKSTMWDDILAGNIPGGIYGMDIEDGTFYALEFNDAEGQSVLWRNLNPDAARAEADTWSRSATTATTDPDDAEVHFDTTPRSLKVSEGKVWAVKTNGTSKIYSFSDIVITITANNPQPGFTSQINPINGAAVDIVFSWARPSTAVTEYELQIARDRDFYVTLVTATITSNEATVAAVVGPKQTGDTFYNFFAGEIYYWRIRVSYPVYSPYSEPRSFSIQPVAATHAPNILTPANGTTVSEAKPAFSWSPVSDAKGYNFVLGTDIDLASPTIDTTTDKPAFQPDEELKPGTYFWRVRSTNTGESVWSALAHFIVAEPAEAAAPPIITFNGPGEIAPPQITPGVITTPPPQATPAPLVPDYFFQFIIFFGLALLVGLLVFIFRKTGPFGIPSGFGDGLRGLGDRLRGLSGDLAGGLGKLNPRHQVNTPGDGLSIRIPAAAPAARTDAAGAPAAEAPEIEMPKAADVAETGRSIAFAIESFLWMTQEVKSDGQRMLSPDEILKTGQSLAAKIKDLAGQTILYSSFPKDAAIFLRIWALYGSREDTNHYLTDTFRARPESVTALLRSYLPAEAGAEMEFGRSQYEAIAESVDTEEVYKVLTGIYGSQLNSLGDTDTSPERTIAARFARIHLALRSEPQSPKTAGQDRAGTV